MSETRSSSAGAVSKPSTKKKASKKAATKKASMKGEAKPKRRQPRMYVVRAGRVVFWPLPGFPLRCRTGGMIREGDPFLKVRGFPDQSYKVRPVTDREMEAGEVVITHDDRERGRVTDVFPIQVTPCNNRRMLREYKEQGISWMPFDRDLPTERSTIVPEPAEIERADVDAEGFEIPTVDPASVASLEAHLDGGEPEPEEFKED